MYIVSWSWTRKKRPSVKPVQPQTCVGKARPDKLAQVLSPEGFTAPYTAYHFTATLASGCEGWARTGYPHMSRVKDWRAWLWMARSHKDVLPTSMLLQFVTCLVCLLCSHLKLGNMGAVICSGELSNCLVLGRNQFNTGVVFQWVCIERFLEVTSQ